jgi:predicted ATPase
LFTDIEGSTRLWQADELAMGAALARHDELLRKAVSECDGVVFSSMGDGLGAAFSSASSAIAAAVTAQQLLSAEVWATPSPIRVRMGVHTGEAEARDGDYLGTAVNRAARLMAIGHGGQVLVSGSTAAVVGDAAVMLVDLGEQRLRDLDRPMRVFQVGRGSFPALRSLDSFLGNLPSTISSFVGRDHEVREVRKLLVERRLVTLTGVGGAGKTRLAVQIAAQLSGRFKDGVWYVDLASIAGPDEVAGAIAAGLRVRHSFDSPLADVLAEYVTGQELLVVMDNCEHVIDQAAVFTERLLGAGSGLKVLATSREPLRVTGEAVWPLHPLGLPAPEAGGEEMAGSGAVRLFVERARDVDPGLILDHDALSIIAEIVTLLDGLPLAVELAASLVSGLGLAEIRRRLDDRFALLTKGRRTALPRHQTLAATLDWSYRLLTADEQALLRRLSVFAGSFDVDAVRAVADWDQDHPGPLSEVVWGLCAKSLLTPIDSRQPERRYRLLKPPASTPTSD